MAAIERKLETTQALIDGGWYEPANFVVERGYDIGLLGEFHGMELTKAVGQDVHSLKDLRGGLAWANSANMWATILSGGDISSLVYDDQLEAAARRVAHNSARYALSVIGTTDKLWLYRRNNGLLGEQR